MMVGFIQLRILSAANAGSIARNLCSVLLHDALAARGLETVAERGRLSGARERTDLGAVVHALVAEIGTADGWLASAENGRIFRLQRPVGGLRLALGLLRRDLHDVSAIGGGRCGARRRARRRVRHL